MTVSSIGAAGANTAGSTQKTAQNTSSLAEAGAAVAAKAVAPKDAYDGGTGKKVAELALLMMAKAINNVGANESSALPVDAPIKNDASSRSAAWYNAAIDQFSVDENPRYTPYKQGKGDTYCNIFIWDVTRAMGAEIPHWRDENGNCIIVDPGESYDSLVRKEYTEVDANGNCDWLVQHGAENGWRQVGAEEAQKMANEGHPAVAAWKNPVRGSPGHIAMVRPGEITSNGPAIAQAGATNFNNGHVADSFGNKDVTYWVHD
jgi:hypothetical protein